MCRSHQSCGFESALHARGWVKLQCPALEEAYATTTSMSGHRDGRASLNQLTCQCQSLQTFPASMVMVLVCVSLPFQERTAKWAFVCQVINMYKVPFGVVSLVCQGPFCQVLGCKPTATFAPGTRMHLLQGANNVCLVKASGGVQRSMVRERVARHLS